MNCGAHGHQEVFHLHMHLLGGRPMGPMISSTASEPSRGVAAGGPSDDAAGS